MKTVQKITAFFLIVAVTLSSLGFTANKMVCLKSGKTKVALTHIKDCCKDEGTAQSTIKSNCCDIQNSSFTLGNFETSEINTTQFSNITSFSAVQNLFDVVPVSTIKTSLSFADSPSPLYGRYLLSFISILVI